MLSIKVKIISAPTFLRLSVQFLTLCDSHFAMFETQSFIGENCESDEYPSLFFFVAFRPSHEELFQILSSAQLKSDSTISCPFLE